MPTRYISKNFPVPDAVSTANGFGFDSDDKLKVNRVTAATGAADAGYVPISDTDIKTASFTITAADHGKTFVANSATSCVFTLPSTVAGLTYTLVVGTVTAGTGHAFSPAAADKFLGNGFTSADDKDAICSGATDREGDAMTIVGDGSAGWYITAVTGTWAREA